MSPISKTTKNIITTQSWLPKLSIYCTIYCTSPFGWDQGTTLMMKGNKGTCGFLFVAWEIFTQRGNFGQLVALFSSAGARNQVFRACSCRQRWCFLTITESNTFRAAKIPCSSRKTSKYSIEDLSILMSAHFESFEEIRHKQRLACSDRECLDVCSKKRNWRGNEEMWITMFTRK